MSIIGSLPSTISNGDAVDAVPVMADFNYIVSQVNANSAVNSNISGVSGTASAISLTISGQTLSSYVLGSAYDFTPGLTSTGATTLSIAGGPITPIYKGATTALVAGDLLAGRSVRVVYDGVGFQLQDDATLVVATFALLASFVASFAGQVVSTAGHTTVGYGSGRYVVKVGTTTTISGIRINCLSSSATAYYLDRIDQQVLSLYDLGVLPNLATDQRTVIQTAVTQAAALGYTLRVPKDTYYFQLTANDQYGVSVPAKSRIIFEKGASFELLSYGAYDNYQVIAVYDVTDVYLENPTVNGRKDLRAANATFTASITGTVMTVTAVASGTIAVGQKVIVSGIAYGTSISSFGTGSGGTGTYNLSITNSITSQTITTFQGEAGMGISIRGSSQVIVRSPTTTNCWGDGMYLGQSTTGGQAYVEDVHVYNHISDSNRRQGMSIISAKNTHVYDAVWQNILGTAPSAGLDIEPNSNTCFFENVRIYNPKTYNNIVGAGITVDLTLMGGATAKHIDVKIYGHRDYGSQVAFLASGANTLNGTQIVNGLIEVVDSYSENSNVTAFATTHWDAKGPRVDIIRPVVINPNRTGGTSPATSSPFSLYRNSATATLNYIVGNMRVIEPTVILDSGTIPKVYYFDNALNDGGEAYNAFIDPILIPNGYSNTMYRGAVSNKYRQGLRQSTSSETITGDNAGLGILTSTVSNATYTLSDTLLFNNGPDIYIEVGDAAHTAAIALPTGGRFVGRAINSGYSIAAGTQGAYMRIKPLGQTATAVFTASITGTVMTVTAVASGTIVNGNRIDGEYVLNGTVITSFGTGAGGTGTYNVTAQQNPVLSQSMISTSATGTARFAVIENVGGWV